MPQIEQQHLRVYTKVADLPTDEVFYFNDYFPFVDFPYRARNLDDMACIKIFRTPSTLNYRFKRLFNPLQTDQVNRAVCARCHRTKNPSCTIPKPQSKK